MVRGDGERGVAMWLRVCVLVSCILKFQVMHDCMHIRSFFPVNALSPCMQNTTGQSMLGKYMRCNSSVLAHKDRGLR